MTKLFEETRRGTLVELAAHYAEAGRPKGEIVIVIGPPEKTAPDADDLDAQLKAALAHSSLKDAVASVTAETGLKRKQVYARALVLAGKGAKP